MLHLLYIFAFTILAFLAVGNLIRNLITLGMDSTRNYPPRAGMPAQNPYASIAPLNRRSAPHPEFLDETGNFINEPLLIMRSITVEDAREQLDSLYNASPSSSSNENREET